MNLSLDLASLITVIPVGYLIDQTRYYRKAHLTLNFVGILAWLPILLIFFTRDQNSAALSPTTMIIAMIPLGICPINLFSTNLSYASELIYPLHDATVNSFMNLVSQTWSFVVMSVFTYLLSDNHTSNVDTSTLEQDDMLRQSQLQTYKALAFLFGCSLLATVLAIFVKEDLRRLNYDRHQQQIYQDEQEENMARDAQATDLILEEAKNQALRAGKISKQSIYYIHLS